MRARHFLLTLLVLHAHVLHAREHKAKAHQQHASPRTNFAQHERSLRAPPQPSPSSPPPLPPLPDRLSGKPLRFFHVPKTGGSLAFALWAWGCTYFERGVRQPHLEAQCRDSFQLWNSSVPIDSLHLERPHRPLGIVPGLLDDAKSIRGHLVGMMRDPVARVASGYAAGFSLCTPLSNGHGRSTKARLPWHVAPEDEEAAVLEYAACVRGCTTRMLTGRSCEGGHVRESEALKAAEMIREDGLFGFLGDTSQWERSICIFVGLYPPRFRYGYNYSALFLNARPNKSPELELRARAILLRNRRVKGAGVNDPDQLVFREALAWLDRMEPHVVGSPHYQLCQKAAKPHVLAVARKTAEAAEELPCAFADSDHPATARVRRCAVVQQQPHDDKPSTATTSPGTTPPSASSIITSHQLPTGKGIVATLALVVLAVGVLMGRYVCPQREV